MSLIVVNMCINKLFSLYNVIIVLSIFFGELIINESIIIREIPTLVRQASIEDIPGIHAIYPSEDMRIMYAINKEGTNIRVIKDGK